LEIALMDPLGALGELPGGSAKRGDAMGWEEGEDVVTLSSAATTEFFVQPHPATT
jgi:hypothetical protein